MSYANLSDEELVALCVAGDRMALAAVYDRYSTVVFSLVVRILGEGMAAEEATQDAFMSLWRRAADFSGDRGRLLSWLLTIARNRAIDELRRSRGRAEPFDVTEPGPSQAGLEEDSLRRMYVRRLLAALPAPQRQVLELAYYHGMTQHEIAEHLGTPLGTIKTRMRLGLQRLRKAIEATSGPPPEGVSGAVHPASDTPT
jgi:RNA polymerase sigma-70 factor, ECF subfamily